MYLLENVDKFFLDGKEIRYIFKNANFHIKKGDMISLVGESGSGKSTLLSMLGILDYPSSGRIFIDGKNIATLNNRDISYIRSQKIGFILQNNYLVDFLNVKENIICPLMLKGINRIDAQSATMDALHRVGMERFVDKDINTLSGGEKQRVSIARAIASNPDIILADEPTGNLDSVNSDKVVDIFKEINAENTTLFVVTHNERIAHQFQRRLILENMTVREY